MTLPSSPITLYTHDDPLIQCNEVATYTESTDNNANQENEPSSNTRHDSTNLTTFPPQAKCTTTLLLATSSTPAITFTRYVSVPPPVFPSTSVTETSSSQPQKREISSVAHAELDAYFHDLRQEFETKTGRMWIPLQPLKYEEWDWDQESVVAEESDNDGEDVDEEKVKLELLDMFKFGMEFDDADIDLGDIKWNGEVTETLVGDVREVKCLGEMLVRASRLKDESG
jgi:hypothetical protein